MAEPDQSVTLTLADGVLSGVRVLDFGRFIAGPYCAALLGDLGADVIRIERPGGAEDRFVLSVAPSGEGPMYLQMNRNKRSMELDTASDEGRETVRRLVSLADVVVANYPPRALKAMGLDWATVSTVNPRAILATATAFGSLGPYAERVGFDTVGQAMSGAVFMTGPPGQPYRTPVQYVDIGTATASAYGVLAALIARERTGRGQWVEASLLKTGLINGAGLIIEEALTGAGRQPTGNLGFTGAPIDLFETRTGWIVVQVLGQPIFERLCAAIDQPELIADRRFVDDVSRGANGAAMSAVMAEWCATRDRDAVLAILGKARVPAAPVLSPREVLDDTHVVETGLLTPLRFDGLMASVPTPPNPVDLSETPPRFRSSPPRLGADTQDILDALPYGWPAPVRPKSPHSS